MWFLECFAYYLGLWSNGSIIGHTVWSQCDITEATGNRRYLCTCVGLYVHLRMFVHLYVHVHACVCTYVSFVCPAIHALVEQPAGLKRFLGSGLEVSQESSLNFLRPPLANINCLCAEVIFIHCIPKADQVRYSASELYFACDVYYDHFVHSAYLEWILIYILKLRMCVCLVMEW